MSYPFSLPLAACHRLTTSVHPLDIRSILMGQPATKTTEIGLKPGVVTGKDYQTLVAAAKAGGYALPAVNVTGTNTVNAVMEAAAKNNADVIIQLSNGGAQFYAGQGMPDGFQAKVLG